MLQWQQGAGGICRFQTRVCGWRQNGVVVSQNNWLFTQHISSDFDSNIYNYDVAIHVEAIYSLQSCRERQGCIQSFNLLHYMTNSQQLPSTSGNGYMNTQNYVKFAVPEGPVSSVTYTNTYNFTLPPSSTGFYIAVQDIGSCIALSRLRVYRNNCKSRQVGLVLYPDAPAPVSGSANIDIGCVENAVVSGSSEVTCGSDGTWGPETPVCQSLRQGTKWLCVIPHFSNTHTFTYSLPFSALIFCFFSRSRNGEWSSGEVSLCGVEPTRGAKWSHHGLQTDFQLLWNDQYHQHDERSDLLCHPTK